MINPDDYQPATYKDILYGNEESKLRIEDIVNGLVPFPAFGKCGILIYGAWGTGKTTLAKLLPAEIELGKTQRELQQSYHYVKCQQGFSGPQLMTLLNGSTSLISFNHSGLHYVVVDEVDNVTLAAQQSLKSVMNTRGTIFVLTTNYLQKIDKGVQDRCVLVELNASSRQQMAGHIQRIAADMNVIFNDNEIDEIFEAAKGSVREATYSAMRRALRKLRGH